MEDEKKQKILLEKHKDIARIDQESKRTHGWYVRVRFIGKTHSKFFSDKKCGGRYSSLLSAISWRDKTEKKLGKVGRDVLARLHVSGKIVSQVFGNIRYYFNAEQDIRVVQIAERQKLNDEKCEEDIKLRHEIILYVVGICSRTISRFGTIKCYLWL